MIQEFFDLIFPPKCLGCSQTMVFQEKMICTLCLMQLPRTNYHRLKEHPIINRISPDIPIHGMYNYLKYYKSGLTASLLYALKYGGKEIIGEQLGYWYACELKKEGLLPNVDLIVPVPLHPQKLRKRGYNQSHSIARGFSEAADLVLKDSILIRTVKGENQALQKGRLMRWENVARIYAVAKDFEVRGKHILIVDDVITSGATMEACASVLIAQGAIKISLLSIGVTL